MDGSRFEQWTRDGYPHREDGPARIERDRDGNLVSEEWWVEGRIHRHPGPAVTKFYPDGTPREEEWLVNNVGHRADGPCLVTYAEDGTVTGQSYRFEGTALRDHAALVRMLRGLTVRRLDQEFYDTAYAPFLDEGVHPHRILDVLEEEIYSIEGIREVFGGAPVEWVRSWESVKRDQ